MNNRYFTKMLLGELPTDSEKVKEDEMRRTPREPELGVNLKERLLNILGGGWNTTAVIAAKLNRTPDSVSISMARLRGMHLCLRRLSDQRGLNNKRFVEWKLVSPKEFMEYEAAQAKSKGEAND